MATKSKTTRTGPLVIDVYARISKAVIDNEGRSVEGQVEDCVYEVEQRGAVVGEVFRDESKSAWNPKVIRPQWNLLMHRLESGASDGVIVYDLSRFSRKMAEGERLVTCADAGQTVWSVFGEYNLGTADGRRHFRNDMVSAAGESDKISERVTRGKTKKARRVKTNASHRGFAMAGYLPNPEGWLPGDLRTYVPADQLQAEREAVQELARRLLKGESWASMVRWINDLGLTTPYGNTWNPSALKQLMERPSLAGIIVHDGQEVGVLEGDPVLDRVTWERCQSVIAARRPGRSPSGRYLLTNLVTCGLCGHPLTGRPRVSAAPYPDGEVARQYWCQKQAGRNTGCGRLSIDQRYADEVVAEMVKTRLGDPRHMERVARRAAKAQTARDKITAEVTRLEQDAESLAGKVAAWGLDRVDAAMAPLDARLVALREQLKSLDVPEGGLVASQDAALQWDGDPEASAVSKVEARRAMVRRAFPEGIVIEPATSRGKAALHTERFRLA